jgi:hypothetical protein
MLGHFCVKRTTYCQLYLNFVQQLQWLSDSIGLITSLSLLNFFWFYYAIGCIHGWGITVGTMTPICHVS